MRTSKLRLVAFGSAKALTRDMIGGLHTEVQIYDSLFPAAG